MNLRATPVVAFGFVGGFIGSLIYAAFADWNGKRALIGALSGAVVGAFCAVRAWRKLA